MKLCGFESLVSNIKMFEIIILLHRTYEFKNGKPFEIQKQSPGGGLQKRFLKICCRPAIYFEKETFAWVNFANVFRALFS